MEKPTFEAYTRPNGQNEFLDYLHALPRKDRNKLLATIAQIEDKGILNAQSAAWVKKIEHNLYEIRSKTGTNIQRALYFQIIRNHYLITHGFTKKTEKTPQKQIIHARHLRDEFESREV